MDNVWLLWNVIFRGTCREFGSCLRLVLHCKHWYRDCRMEEYRNYHRERISIFDRNWHSDAENDWQFQSERHECEIIQRQRVKGVMKRSLKKSCLEKRWKSSKKLAIMTKHWLSKSEIGYCPYYRQPPSCVISVETSFFAAAPLFDTLRGRHTQHLSNNDRRN